MVDWSHLHIADNLRMIKGGLSSLRTFIRSISDCRGRPHLERSSSEVSSPRNLLKQCRQVRFATAPSPSAANIWRAVTLELFPN